MDCELNRKSIFSGFSERYSYSLHYYEAGQFAHLSIEWILVSLAGRAASPSPRTPRRTADRHRPCPPRRTSPPPAVRLLIIYIINYFLKNICIFTLPASHTPAPADASSHAGTRTETFRYYPSSTRYLISIYLKFLIHFSKFSPSQGLFPTLHPQSVCSKWIERFISPGW